VGRLRLFAIFECFVASFVAYFTTHLLRAPHSHYPPINVPAFTWEALFAAAVAGAVFGLAARAFARLTHLIEQANAKWISYPPLKPAIAGVVLIALYALEGSYHYVGLGIPMIQQALLQPASFKEPLFKGLFTAITVGSGFKGGEFIPLVFIGATAGSALATILPLAFPVLAALGFAAVFAGAANTPIACSIMAIELFGPRLAPYAAVACAMSYYFSGHHGIYKSQKIHVEKHKKIIKLIKDGLF
jgi:H+/Cl- antiporter ClcA